MPAYTVGQLSTKLAQYVEPSGDFTEALAQVLPWVYSLGMWRDLTYECSLPAEHDYISLPADSESVISCTVNDLPRPVRSLWHDIRIIGRNPILSPYFGIVDAGFYPVMLDMKEVQDVDDVDDVVAVGVLSARTANTTTPLVFADFAGEVTINVTDAAGLRSDLVATDDGDDLTYAPAGAAFLSVNSIVYEGITEEIDLVDPDFPTMIIATIPAGSGVLRFRRFRVSESGTDSVVHLLVKRACPSNLTEDTIVYLGNLAALKHALLCRVAEDNADIVRADYHKAKVLELLDSELDAHRGAAKPQINLDIWGNPAPYGIY